MTQLSTATGPAAGRRPYRPEIAAWQAAAVSAVWFAVIGAAHYVHTGPHGHRVALTLHLLSLTIGFGAVLGVDAFGLLVLAGRRGVGLLLRLSGNADPLIWAGLAGLAVSGIWLDPHFGSGWTLLNLWAVLAVGLNGVYARTIRRQLPALADGANLMDVPKRWRDRALLSALVSQAAWWTSILIGTFAS